MLHVIIWFSLLFAFTEAIFKCGPNEIFDMETKMCEELKCPHGQVWLEDVEKCVKFRRIVSGDEKDIVEEDSNGKKKCRDGFIWVPSLKMCAKRPKFCNNAACVEVKKPKSQEDCPPNREWNPAKRKCLKPKQVETIFTEKPET